MRSRRFTAVTAAVLAAGSLAWTPTSSGGEADVTPVERHRQEASTGTTVTLDDEGDLENFEHVFHFGFEDFVLPGASEIDQGTDIEFYTPTVPRRDRETGEKVLDGEGNEILEERDFAIVGSYDRGAFVFDITDPEDTFFVSWIECNQRQNDVQIKRFDDRWLLALARDGSTPPCIRDLRGQRPAAGIAVFDVTDPYEWAPLYSFGNTGGAHNFTFHPTQPYGWVSTGDLPGGINHIPIVDFTDPDQPKLVNDIEVEGGPHDLAFSADGTRAYVASENNVRIYDTTDPADPVELSVFPAPAVYVHGADPTPDGEHLIVTDESLVLGGFFASESAVCPGGGITIYDIAGDNEQQPLPVGYGLADHQGRSPDHRACTAHVGRISPNSDFYVTGWYIGGVRMFDISDPSNPTDVGHAMMPATEVWSAKFHRGPYVYTGDLGRGFDVYRWTGEGDLGTPPVAGQQPAHAVGSEGSAVSGLVL